MSNSSAAALVDQGTPLEPWRKRFDDTRALEVLLRLLAALPSPIDGTAMLNAAAAADHSSPSLAAVAPATEALELDHGSISGMDLDATAPLVSTAPSAPKILEMPRPRVKRVLGVNSPSLHSVRSRAEHAFVPTSAREWGTSHGTIKALQQVQRGAAAIEATVLLRVATVPTPSPCTFQTGRPHEDDMDLLAVLTDGLNSLLCFFSTASARIIGRTLKAGDLLKITTWEVRRKVERNPLIDDLFNCGD